MLVRAALIVVIAAMAVGAGLSLATGDGLDARAAAVMTAPVTADVTSGHSYCDAARAVLEYEGHDPARRAELADQVLAKSPPELMSTLVTIRHSRPSSDAYVKAYRLWDYYNNNHCCQCVNAHDSPHIDQLTPEQRAHIEAGRPL